MLGLADRVDIAAGADDADAEQLARHARQRRIDLRILALVVGLETRMCVTHELLHFLRRRQVTGRDIPGTIVKSRVHRFLPNAFGRLAFVLRRCR